MSRYRLTLESETSINSCKIKSSLITLEQNLTRKYDDIDKENKVDKDDDSDHYGSIRGQKHYSAPA